MTTLYLTEQQNKFLQALLEGKTMKQISTMLGVSYSRVIQILNIMLLKTNCKSRTELLVKGKDFDIKIKENYLK